MNQEEHHKTKSFKEEYLKMLTDFDVAYDENTYLSFIPD
jgi:putative transposase